MKIVLITAMWCSSCIIMRPRYDKFKEMFEFVELDYDYDDVSIYNPDKTLPVAIVFKENKEIKRIIGEKSNKELNKIFEELK